jgi:hypothetical protein
MRTSWCDLVSDAALLLLYCQVCEELLQAFPGRTLSLMSND